MNKVGYFEIGKNGRIGNQLFQIFSTVGVAYKNNAKYHFNDNNIFKCLPNISPVFKYFNATSHWGETHNLKFEDIEVPEDLHLHGYFQSYKYFDFLPDEFFGFYAEQHLKYMNYDLPCECFIHIRRGDYVNVSSLLLSKQYYLDAIDIMKGLGINTFLIFTDDVEFCKKEYGDIEGVTIASPSGDDYYDLLIMSLFKYGIISNSSYSWWGSYLNRSPYKIIAPLHWFDKNEIDTEDLIPKKWERIWDKKYVT